MNNNQLEYFIFNEYYDEINNEFWPGYKTKLLTLIDKRSWPSYKLNPGINNIIKAPKIGANNIYNKILSVQSIYLN